MTTWKFSFYLEVRAIPPVELASIVRLFRRMSRMATFWTTNSTRGNNITTSSSLVTIPGSQEDQWTVSFGQRSPVSLNSNSNSPSSSNVHRHTRARTVKVTTSVPVLLFLWRWWPDIGDLENLARLARYMRPRGFQLLVLSALMEKDAYVKMAAANAKVLLNLIDHLFSFTFGFHGLGFSVIRLWRLETNLSRWWRATFWIIRVERRLKRGRSQSGSWGRSLSQLELRTRNCPEN